jgi:sugar lactone lactonase YvrE
MDSQAMSRLRQYALAAGVAALVAGCGGGSSPPAMSRVPEGETPGIPVPVKYAVGGTVSGLGAGALLTLNFGSEKLAVSANDNFAFPNKVETGAAYSVSASAPAGYTCRVTDATGVVAAADVGKIAVACAPVVLAGTLSALQLPLAVSADGAGNLYVVDSLTSSVVKFSATGAVTVLAGGSGKPGFADGPAASARFRFGMADLAVDAQGNVLVADGCNNVIRKIRPDGEVSTLAGGAYQLCKYQSFVLPAGGSSDGAGGQAQFALPNRITSDGAGGALVLDVQNRGMVRKVSASGVVTGQYWRNPNLAEGDLTFTTVALGADGTLYMSDSRRRIWKDVAGVLVLVAGQAASGAAVDGAGAAARFRAINDMVVAPGGDLYVADSTQVRKVTPAGVVSTVAGGLAVRSGTDGQGLAAGFGSIRSMTLDGAGLVVLDGAQGNLRRVGFDGTVSALAATPNLRGNVDGAGSMARLGGLGALTADADGNLYTVEPDQHVLRKTTPDGRMSTIGGQAGVRGTTDGALAAALFDAPHTVAAGRDGVLWVAQLQGLRKIQNGTVSTVGASLEVYDLAVDADGNAVIVDAMQQVVRVTPDGQTTVLVSLDKVTALLKNPDAAFSPAGMVADSAGNLYIADGGSSVVYKLAKSGELSVFAGTPGKDAGNIDGPVGTATLGFYDYSAMTVDDKGNVYISGQGNVRMISPGGVVSTPALGWGTPAITAMAYAKGKLYGLTRWALLQTWLP